MKIIKILKYLLTAITGLISACATTSQSPTLNLYQQFAVGVAVERGVRKAINSTDAPDLTAKRVLEYAYPIRQLLDDRDVGIEQLGQLLIDRLPPAISAPRRQLYLDLITVTVNAILDEVQGLPDGEQLLKAQDRAARLLDIIIDTANNIIETEAI